MISLLEIVLLISGKHAKVIYSICPCAKQHYMKKLSKFGVSKCGMTALANWISSVVYLLLRKDSKYTF